MTLVGGLGWLLAALSLAAVAVLVTLLLQAKKKLSSFRPVEQEMARLAGERQELNRRHHELTVAHQQLERRSQDVANYEHQTRAGVAALEQRAHSLRQELTVLESEADLLEFGFYEFQFDLRDSDAYARNMKALTASAKSLLKNNQAWSAPDTFTFNGVGG